MSGGADDPHHGCSDSRPTDDGLEALEKLCAGLADVPTPAQLGPGG